MKVLLLFLDNPYINVTLLFKQEVEILSEMTSNF